MHDQCAKPQLADSVVELHRFVQDKYASMVACTDNLQVASVFNRQCEIGILIESRVIERTVTVAVFGRFDLSLNTALWAASRWGRNRVDSYLIQLNDVTELRYSGRLWMIMFKRKDLRRDEH